MRGALLLLFLLVALGAGAWWLRGREPAPGPPPDPPPAVRAEARFVGSDACRDCHEERHETWLETAHAYSLRPPSEDTVEGRFDGVPVQAKHFVATPERRGRDWYVRVQGRDARWPSGDYRVSHVVGRHFEQAYLFTGPRGEWRVLPICWSIERGRWDLTHEVLLDIVGSVDRVTEDFDTRVMIFNHGCGQCHATDYDIGHELPAEGAPVYRSRYLEGAVACESCHGPGSVHAEWHTRADASADYDGPARLLHPKRDLDAVGVLDSCGRCHYQHGWRYAIDDDPRTSFHDIAITQAYDQGGFFADGRLNGLRYHGTTQSQSACYEGGMSCLSCHRMHGGKRGAMKWDGDDDAQCTQCHDGSQYAAKTHTFHDGVGCVDCHMPKLLKKDRVLHFMRDHSIRSPLPALTERFGSDHAPNACNLCHTDQTAGWAREWRDKWWGSGGPGAEALARGVGLVVDLRKEAARVDTARIAGIAADKGQKRFFRLTALRELGRRTDEAARAAVVARLGDADPEVVQIALAGLGDRPPGAAGPALLRLLEHPVRTVRVDAAWALTRMGWRADGEDREALWRETEGMLVRQGHFLELLVRITAIADALGRFDDSTRYLQELLRKAPADALDGLHRRARWFTEEGRHRDALVAYGEVRTALPEGETERVRLLFIDSADSLAALGALDEAASNWSHAVATFPRDSVLFAIAEARLRTLRGDRAGAVRILEDTAKRLEQEPWNRELLRRVRWSLTQVR